MSVRTKHLLEKVIRELESLFSHIHQLPHLETINLTFDPIYDNRPVSDHKGRLALQALIVRALAASFGVRINPKLTFLSIHNMRTWDLSPLESAPSQTFLATVRHLQLSVLFDATRIQGRSSRAGPTSGNPSPLISFPPRRTPSLSSLCTATTVLMPRSICPSTSCTFRTSAHSPCAILSSGH